MSEAEAEARRESTLARLTLAHRSARRAVEQLDDAIDFAVGGRSTNALRSEVQSARFTLERALSHVHRIEESYRS